MPEINSFLINPHLAGQAYLRPGAGPDGVLLFHGFTATVSEVDYLGQALNEAGFTTVGPLLPGHGTRPEDLNHVRWQDWIESAETAYRDLAARCHKVFVGGESNGGLVALYLAAEHPEITGVLAYSPALRLPLSPAQRWMLHLLAPFGVLMPKGDLTGNQVWQGYKVNPVRGVVQLLAFQREVQARLPKITQPILIVQGRHDQTIDPHSSQLVYEQVCSIDKELHWMENSGHCVLLDPEREQVAALTLAFMHKTLGTP